MVNGVTNEVCKRPLMTFHLLEEQVIVIGDTETLFFGDKTLMLYPAVNGSVFVTLALTKRYPSGTAFFVLINR